MSANDNSMPPISLTVNFRHGLYIVESSSDAGVNAAGTSLKDALRSAADAVMVLRMYSRCYPTRAQS